jgi:hypothetical protein
MIGSQKATMSDYIMDSTEPIKTTASRVGGAVVVSDLSRRIEQSVEREPLDAVRCVRVFGDFYRCNWWSRLGTKRKGADFDWGGLITDHVRQSRFLKATVRGEDLILEDVPSSGTGERSEV